MGIFFSGKNFKISGKKSVQGKLPALLNPLMHNCQYRLPSGLMGTLNLADESNNLEKNSSPKCGDCLQTQIPTEKKNTSNVQEAGVSRHNGG